MSQIDRRTETAGPADNKPADAADERVVYRANPAMFRAHPVWFCAGLGVILGGLALAVAATRLDADRLEPIDPAIVAWAGLGVAGAGLVAMAWWWLQTLRTTLTVTTSRTRLRRGLLSVHMTEVWHRHVRNVQLEQSVWERVFGVGTLSIASAGKASWDIQVTGLPRIHKAKRTIDEHRLAVND